MELRDLLAQAVLAVASKLQVKEIIAGVAQKVTDTSCTLIREDEPEITGVRLNALDDELTTYVTTVPAEKSVVLAAIIEGEKTEAVVISCSEVQKVIWKVGETKLEFDKDGWLIGRGNESLKKLLEDLITQVMELKVTTNTGASTAVINKPKLQLIHDRVKDIFKG